MEFVSYEYEIKFDNRVAQLVPIAMTALYDQFSKVNKYIVDKKKQHCDNIIFNVISDRNSVDLHKIIIIVAQNKIFLRFQFS